MLYLEMSSSNHPSNSGIVNYGGRQ
uniref:Uncharacterized protein n=1 Tax=Rhizophora mucronata TaxID=61149 RepID=A0A2P2NBT0_RHIMU